MKRNSLIIIILLCFTHAYSQKEFISDSLVVFKVMGNCEQCKDRIEKAATKKNVSAGIWDVDTKMLTLHFNPTKTTVEKIQKRIVSVGHDIGSSKANTAVYNALPGCCHYRDNSHNDANDDHTGNIEQQEISSDSITQVNTDTSYIRGIVLEENRKGGFRPLRGASIVWFASGKGVSSDSSGSFSIPYNNTENQLTISYAGYKPDTITVTNNRELKVILAAGEQLKEVLITSRQRSTYLSSISPVRTQVITGKELLKAACCNLSESFETNPSVDVSYNDAVTGSKQIQLLGLSGNYTQLTVENLPGPRGIATPLGLNSIAGPWIESIQLIKGTGSVANGYESIAGQINVELKKPEKSEALLANVYTNDFGKTDLNLNLAKKFGIKWSTVLLLHDDFMNNKTLDFNKDGFRDQPTGNQFSAVNRWKYEDGKGVITQFGIKILKDKKTGGETMFDEATDKFTTNKYGLGINTSRYEAFAKMGYVFPQKKYQSIGLQLSAVDHQQDSYFGTLAYTAQQKNFYSNLIYQSIIGNTNHKFRTGISFLYDRYNEDFNSINYNRTEKVPGAFFEYTYDYKDKLTIVAGMRTDHSNLFGWFATPRLNIKYEPVKGTTLHLSAGRGQRTANIFAENTSVFVSSREVMIMGSTNGKAYGLNAEVAWNKGISIDQKIKLFQRDAMFSVDYFRNDFTSQVIADMETAGQIHFYNLNGKSYSNSLQGEFNFEPLKNFDIKMAYRYFDVKTTYRGKLLERPFIAKHRAFVNAAYAIKGWKFDYTITLNGRKRIPSTMDNPVVYQAAPYSPAYILMNAQVTKSIGKNNALDIYIGAENISNYFQQNAIIAAAAPFSQYFDASLVWGPVSGRMLYAGLRFKIKE